MRSWAVPFLLWDEKIIGGEVFLSKFFFSSVEVYALTPGECIYELGFALFREGELTLSQRSNLLGGKKSYRK